MAISNRSIRHCEGGTTVAISIRLKRKGSGFPLDLFLPDAQKKDAAANCVALMKVK